MRNGQERGDENKWRGKAGDPLLYKSCDSTGGAAMAYGGGTVTAQLRRKSSGGSIPPARRHGDCTTPA